MTQATLALKTEIKELIVQTLNIEGVKPEEIKDELSLFEPGNALELDSVDALEIVMALQRKYGVKLDDQNASRQVLKCINTMAEFVAANKKA